ncbi:MAG: hypothetical protein IJY99_03035 [Alphaproteobacteria bacterium]|nr:hypothetical protein [Alphaproteobacteria bacterium]
MAKVISKYIAEIKQGDNLEVHEVDLLNPPRDMYSAENPMSISGDVVLPKGKKAPLPDFTGIVIFGAFDCSTFTLNSNSVLPQGISSLDCSYSIGDLGVLIDILPATVTKVFVRGAILNSIKKDKDDARRFATEFQKKYPDVCVSDGKSTLNDILAEIDRAKENVVNSNIVAPVVEQKNNPPEKTDDWLDQGELLNECKKASDILAEFPDADLSRYVKIARSGLGVRGIKSYIMRREDGVDVMCTNRSNIDAIVTRIFELIDENQARLDKNKKTKTAKKEAPKKEPAPVAEKQDEASSGFYVGTQQVVPVKIKKYIPTRLWGQLRSACGDNKKMLLGFLNDINAINVNPASTQGKKVAYIQDGELKFSNTIFLKSAQSLAQSFSKENNRARIIWAVCGNVFLCTDFFPEHEKAKRAYQKTIRKIDINLSDFDLNDTQEYKNVEDLIKELGDGHDDLGPADTAPTSPKKSKARKKAIAKDMVAEPVETVAEPVETVAEPEVVSDKVAKITPRSQAPVWKDLYSMRGQFEVLMDEINKVCDVLVLQLSTEKDTDKMLHATQQLQEVLAQKKKYEDAIKKISVVKQQLTDLHSLLERSK